MLRGIGAELGIGDAPPIEGLAQDRHPIRGDAGRGEERTADKARCREQAEDCAALSSVGASVCASGTSGKAASGRSLTKNSRLIRWPLSQSALRNFMSDHSP